MLFFIKSSFKKSKFWCIIHIISKAILNLKKLKIISKNLYQTAAPVNDHPMDASISVSWPRKQKHLMGRKGQKQYLYHNTTLTKTNACELKSIISPSRKFPSNFASSEAKPRALTMSFRVWAVTKRSTPDIFAPTSWF